MSRPALSALRALEIIDLMAGMPSHALTISEIVRLTGTNIASCHAILNVLVTRGYLLRHPVHKTYRLAPSIAAIGEAAAANDSLLTGAREAAAAIAKQTKLETLLTARAGNDIIGLARFATSRFVPVNLRVGQRIPMRPPMGSLFYAWTKPEEAERWIAPEGDKTDPEAREIHRAALDLIRERGYLVTLHSAAHTEFTQTLHRDSKEEQDRRQLGDLLRALDNSLYQPQHIADDAEYQVRILSVPIFDAHGQVQYIITLNFPAFPTVSGRDIKRHATDLISVCAAVMADNHIDHMARVAM